MTSPTTAIHRAILIYSTVLPRFHNRNRYADRKSKSDKEPNLIKHQADQKSGNDADDGVFCKADVHKHLFVLVAVESLLQADGSEPKVFYAIKQIPTATTDNVSDGRSYEGERRQLSCEPGLSHSNRPGHHLEVLPEDDFVFSLGVESADYRLPVVTKLVIE